MVTFISVMFPDGNEGELLFLFGLSLDVVSIVLFIYGGIKNSIGELTNYLHIHILPSSIISKHFSAYSHKQLEIIKNRFIEMAKGKLILVDTEALTFQKDLILNAQREIFAVHLVNCEHDRYPDLGRWYDPQKDFSILVAAYENVHEQCIIKSSQSSELVESLQEYLRVQEKIGFKCKVLLESDISNILSVIWPEYHNETVEDILIIDREIVLVAITPQSPFNSLNKRKTQSIIYEDKLIVQNYIDAFEKLTEHILLNRTKDISDDLKS